MSVNWAWSFMCVIWCGYRWCSWCVFVCWVLLMGGCLRTPERRPAPQQWGQRLKGLKINRTSRSFRAKLPGPTFMVGSKSHPKGAAMYGSKSYYMHWFPRHRLSLVLGHFKTPGSSATYFQSVLRLNLGLRNWLYVSKGLLTPVSCFFWNPFIHYLNILCLTNVMSGAGAYPGQGGQSQETTHSHRHT